MADILKKPNWVCDEAGDWWYHAPSGRRHRERGVIRQCGHCQILFPCMKGSDDLRCSRLCAIPYQNLGPGNAVTRPDLFVDWTPDECWLVGVIWSDGCLMKLNRGPGQIVRIAMTSEDVVEQAANIAGCCYHSLRRRDPTRQPKHVMSIGSRFPIARLEGIGLAQRKSETAGWPDLPHPAAFLRGVFDGDGSVMIDRRNRLRSGLCGGKELLSGVNGFLEPHGITPKRIRLNGRSKVNWSMEWQRSDSLLLSDVMYADGGPHMERKRAIFDRWRSEHQ